VGSTKTESKKFTEADYAAVLSKFAALADEKYKKFNASLTPGVTRPAYGVRVPQVRAIAKEIAKTDPFGFLDVCKDVSAEETQLHAYVIANMKLPLAEKLPLIADFVPLIDSWGICDTFCFKVTDSEKPLLWDFLQAYFASDKTYFLRYAVVTGIVNFVNDSYIDEYLSALSRIKHEDYYVKIAVAWALCDCFIKQRAKTDALLSTKTLDAWTQNKAIQKCRESFRVSAEDKTYLLTLKL
jgi:3-methyladenine DNA glycosylase AlkD